MALSAATVFEVRSTGSDSNGGGFVTGASGTDFSQQNAAQFALTGIASTAGASATVNTATAATTMVGNIAQVISGTNFVAGLYQIISVVAGTSITFDRACTTATGAAGVINIGGSFATPNKAVTAMTVTGMITWIKATATYSLTASVTAPSGISPTVGFNRVVGYTTTRGDRGQVTFTAASSITAITDAVGGFRWENINIAGASTISIGFSFNGQNSALYNCTVKSVNNNGVNALASAQNLNIIQCELGACGAEGVSLQAPNCTLSGNYIHNSGSHGIEIIGSGQHIIRNLIVNNNSKGILMNVAYSVNKSIIQNNTIYGNASDGVANTGVYGMAEIANNIFVNNGGFGLITTSMNPLRDEVLLHNNAFFNNTSGNRSGNNAGTGDVTLTGVPFTNAAAFDFSLNSTAGQGAACKAVGYPGIFPGGLTTGFLDIGAVQSAGGGGTAPTVAYVSV